ncbi:MAG: AAA family ATPase [Bacteroidota bacterium]
MHISKFRIHNYKSYLDSNDVNLESGINIITGQNNAGKTALLQALSLHFVDSPHRSTKTISTQLEKVKSESSIYLEFNISKEDFVNYIFNDFTQFLIPHSDHVEQRYYNNRGFIDTYLQGNNILQVTFPRHGAGIKSAVLKQLPQGHPTMCYKFNLNKDLKSFQYVNSFNAPSSFHTIADLLKQRVYFFHAERLSLGSCAHGVNNVLSPTASNLPEVLNILQSDLNRFERYNRYIRKIFPQIFRVSVIPRENNRVEVVVWNEDPELERNDLVVPLDQCGTGLGQVLAILYVVLTSDIPKIIIIDEPNSFLHPGAARKLIEILKEHSQHQFIISTHSPSTIAAANPKTINIIKNREAQSYIEAIDVEETNQQQLYLAEIGAKLSDVFGADNILWVEGKTEEICFPKIIETTSNLSLMGTSILGVKNTGDFQSKNSGLVFDIYKKLSVGKGLMPAAVGFVFDKEELTERQIKDLERKSGKKVHFIGRRLYENYLLNPQAIFEVLNEIDMINISQEDVDNWIEQNKWKRKFISQENAKIKTQDNWLEKVDGANFLSALFSELTKSKVCFDKIKHSVALTEWIIENSIEDLKELQDLLTQILKPSTSN